MKKKIVLAGNGVTAEILLSYLYRDARYEVVAATVDEAFVASSRLRDIASVPIDKLSATHPPSDVSIIMASGYNDLNRVRESLFTRLGKMGYKIETYIHPEAKVYSENALGEGSIILPNAVVEPFATIGKNSFIWCNVTVAHHSRVGDHCWLAAGAVVSGQAAVGDNAFLGVNATVVNEISVGDHCIIGAAAMISKNTSPRTVHLARSAEQVRFTADQYVAFSSGV